MRRSNRESLKRASAGCARTKVLRQASSRMRARATERVELRTCAQGAERIELVAETRNWRTVLELERMLAN